MGGLDMIIRGDAFHEPGDFFQQLVGLDFYASVIDQENGFSRMVSVSSYNV